MMTIPVDKARALAHRRAKQFGYNAVEPGAPQREAVLLGLAAVHKLTGSGWDLAYAREHVTVTLPGLGTTAATLLAAIPKVGPLLHACCSEHTSVYYSRAAWDRGDVLVGTTWHEEGHVGDIVIGGLAWCIAYGLFDEVRAAGEAPCYGASMSAQVRFAGLDPREAEKQAKLALLNYGLGPEALRLAHAQLAFHRATLEQPGGDPGGMVAEMVAALAEVV